MTENKCDVCGGEFTSLVNVNGKWLCHDCYENAKENEVIAKIEKALTTANELYDERIGINDEARSLAIVTIAKMLVDGGFK